MAISLKEVEHVALLARLDLNQKEKEIFAQQVSSILVYVDKLKELDTDNVEPLEHILPVYNIFRADQVMPSPPREELLANGPQVEDGQFKVPKIL